MVSPMLIRCPGSLAANKLITPPSPRMTVDMREEASKLATLVQFFFSMCTVMTLDVCLISSAWGLVFFAISLGTTRSDLYWEISWDIHSWEEYAIVLAHTCKLPKPLLL